MISLPEDLALPVARYADDRTLLSFFHSAKKYAKIWEFILEWKFPNHARLPYFSAIENYFIMTSPDQCMYVMYTKNNFDMFPIVYNVRDPEDKFYSTPIQYFRLTYRYFSISADGINSFDDYSEALLLASRGYGKAYIIDLSQVELYFDRIYIHRKKSSRAVAKVSYRLNGGKQIEYVE